MSKRKQSKRVVIALTETSPVPDLWDAAMRVVKGSSAEFVAIFLHDERWERAASLPFTRKVSLTGGGDSDFTARRAAQLLSETAEKLQKNIEELASRSGLPVAFEVLPETDRTKTRALFSSDTSIVVGPSALASHPFFVELQSSSLRIVFIEPEEEKGT